MVSEMWRSSARLRAYAPIFWQHLIRDTSVSEKVGFAAIAVVFQALLDSVTVLAVVTLGFFALDFLSGILRVLRNRKRERLRLARAGDSFVKLGLYVIMWQCGVLMDLLAIETAGINTQGSLAAAALGIVILMEVTSIADNVTEAFPQTRPYFDRILSLLPAKTEDDP